MISAGPAYEGLVDRGRLQAGETVLITAAAEGVGTAAVQIAVAQGARTLGVASPANHDYLRAWAQVTCSITTPLTGFSRCVRPLRAGSMCCWIAPAARPTTK